MCIGTVYIIDLYGDVRPFQTLCESERIVLEVWSALGRKYLASGLYKLSTCEVARSNLLALTRNPHLQEPLRVCLKHTFNYAFIPKIYIKDFLSDFEQFCKIFSNVWKITPSRSLLKILEKIQNEECLGICFDYIDSGSWLLEKFVFKSGKITFSQYNVFVQTKHWSVFKDERPDYEFSKPASLKRIIFEIQKPQQIKRVQFEPAGIVKQRRF